MFFLSWLSDIKKLYRLTGVDNKPTVFLFNDTQIVDESFLEDINNILSSGEVPNLYKQDEFVEVCIVFNFHVYLRTWIFLLGNLQLRHRWFKWTQFQSECSEVWFKLLENALTPSKADKVVIRGQIIETFAGQIRNVIVTCNIFLIFSVSQYCWLSLLSKSTISKKQPPLYLTVWQTSCAFIDH